MDLEVLFNQGYLCVSDDWESRVSVRGVLPNKPNSINKKTTVERRTIFIS
jgi:hypothetical protein